MAAQIFVMRDVIFTVWCDACDRVGQCTGAISTGFSLGDPRNQSLVAWEKFAHR